MKDNKIDNDYVSSIDKENQDLNVNSIKTKEMSNHKNDVKADLLNSDEQDEFDDFSMDSGADIDHDPTYKTATKSMIGRLENIRRRNWFARNFRPVADGGIRSSSFTLITGTVGAGILGLPVVGTYFGLTLALCFVLFFGCLTIWSYAILNDAIVHSNKRGYVNLCAYYFGKNGGYSVVFIFIVTQQMVTAVYCVIAWQFIQNIIREYDWFKFNTISDANGEQIILNYDPENWLFRLCVVGALGVLMLPLVLAKKLSVLKYLSLASFAIIIYTIGLAVVQTPMYYEHFKDDPKYKFTLFVRDFDLKWFQGIATLLLSYICHPLFFNIRKELVQSNPRRTNKVIVISIIFMMVINSLLITAGYLSLGEEMQTSLYILRRKIDKGSLDIAMKIAQFLFLIVVLTCIPVNIFPCREQIASFWKIDLTKLKNHVIITLVINFIGWSVAILYPDIMSIFGIFGGIFATTVGLIIPFLIKIRMEQKHYKKKFCSPKIILHVFLLIMCIFIGCGSTYESIFGN